MIWAFANSGQALRREAIARKEVGAEQTRELRFLNKSMITDGETMYEAPPHRKRLRLFGRWTRRHVGQWSATGHILSLVLRVSGRWPRSAETILPAKPQLRRFKRSSHWPFSGVVVSQISYDRRSRNWSSVFYHGAQQDRQVH
jgi:hypothetical protein